ncbi:alpha/beta hydrolase [Sphingomonas sp.]|jgi:pimeloyl-ACP methyl ester carboxylesterase|uniref:alpha/beta fold hydrolase n=1 Tax=Sphingomonas sp. TaxID=28214 RepID=UPI002E31830A|nr:alpha/beta hydrolase [Sphingomonas sp.]HEX4694095.1 alpha/beta hydrolase [Sphingomonas sp.]
MKAQANGIEIEFEDYGDKDSPPVLLIMGLGAQLTLWPMPMVDQLVARGYRAIRYDNRDVGLSTKFDHEQAPAMAAIIGEMMMGAKPDVPYLIGDMAADAIGLLDALRIAKAHIMGASMGGMIAQMVAAAYPERVLSLTSIMSTTGNPALPSATREAMAVLTQRPTSSDEESMVAHGVRAEKVIGSPGYPADEAELSERVRASFRRMHYPPGIARQMAAIVGSGDRREALRGITAPTMVIHGVDDPLVPLAGGRDTAETIPGAKIVEIPGMGHNLPEPLIPQVLDAFEQVARKATAPAA